MSRRSELRRLIVYKSDPHTRIKHTVYRGYVNCWMGKVLQAAWHNGGTIVDAFSGAGYYLDNLDGSPLVIAKAYAAHTARDRFKPLHLVTLDANAERTAMVARCLGDLEPTPGFSYDVRTPGAFAVTQQEILMEVGARRGPVLWILDPYGLKDIPYTSAAACVQRSGDEAIVTLMLDEMHRFASSTSMAPTMNKVFGDDSWTAAVAAGQGDEARTKDALVRAYQHRFQQSGCITARFDIRVRNRTPRYALILISRHRASLECWNPITWQLDPNRGVGAAVQDELAFGPDLSPLRAQLTALAGRALPWSDLQHLALAAGFTAAHLRTALTELTLDDMAVRMEPASSKTPWPTSSTVRFFDDDE
jgi:three-Cys-motif partner protein